MRSFSEGQPGAGLTIARELFTHADEVARLHRDVFAIPPSTSVAAQPNGFDVRLASGDQVHVPYEPDWDAIELPLGVTARLYLYTARFLPLLLEVEHTERTEDLVSGYFAWIRRKSSEGLQKGFDSWDHATAWRLEVAWRLYAITGQRTRREILASIHDDLAWATQPENIKLNNHGAFLVSALLFCAPHLEPSAAAFAQPLKDAVSDRLPRILELVYGTDVDGWCAENSPMYDRVWINLLRAMMRAFEPELRDIGLADRLETIVERAHTVSRALILPNARYVPRGDSPRQRTSLTPLPGTHWNERVGVWVHQRDGLYVMATSGHAAVTHKHVDETQVYLHWDETDFFLDGGFHSYDYSDPRVVALRSNYGHSVLDVDPAPLLPPWKAYRKGQTRISGRIFDPTERSVQLHKRVDEHHLIRSLLVLDDPRMLVFHDRVSSSQSVGMVARFLLANNASVERTAGGLTISRLGRRLDVTFQDPIDATITAAETRSPHRGWYSTAANELVAGSCLELRPRDEGSTAMSYTVRMS